MCHDGWWCAATMQTKRFNVGIKKKRILMTRRGEIKNPFFSKKVLFRVLCHAQKETDSNKVSTLLNALVDAPPVDVPAVASGQDDRPIEGDFRLTHDGFFRETF